MSVGPLFTGWRKLAPFGRVTSMYSGSVTTSWPGPRAPFTRPEMILTFAPPSRATSGIWLRFTSRYLGSIILWEAGRLAHSWTPPPAALYTALRHLLVDDAAPRGPPPDVPRSDVALVAQAVSVLHIPPEDVGDRLDPPGRAR